MNTAPEGEVKTPDACSVSTDSKVEDPSFSAQGASLPPPGGAAPSHRPYLPAASPSGHAAPVSPWWPAGFRSWALLTPYSPFVAPHVPAGKGTQATQGATAQARHRRLRRLRPCSLLCALPGSSQAPGLARAIRRHPTRAEKPKRPKPLEGTFALTSTLFKGILKGVEKKVYPVRITKKALKGLERMPKDQQDRFHRLTQYLQENGPIAKIWPNFSSLGGNKYHCHLSFHWVACWTYEKEILTIEVYYAGSRENAPY